MMKKVLILIPVVMIWGKVLAQTSLPDPAISQTVQPEILRQPGLEHDSLLVRLVGLHVRKNERIRGTSGFRVEIFFSSALDARQNALQMKTSFLKEYPDIGVYVIYVSPDFKVRVGDFRTKNEALALMKKIQDRYPKAFIVPDIIEFPNLN